MEEYKLNGTDRKVIRQLSLLNLFVQHPKGVLFDDVDPLIYGEDSKSSLESRKRKFHRDRDVLEDALGLITHYDEKSDKYYVDRDNSFVDSKSASLTREEKIALRDVVIPHLLESYADQTDLIIALNKLGVPLAHSHRVLPEDATEINFIRGSLGIKYVIWNCFINRTACTITYTTANEVQHTYDARIYGTFSVAENQYFVANVGENGNDDIRTLRYDRVDEITPKSGSKHRYEIPEDYQDYKHLKLPFQIGETLYTARVFIEKENAEDFESVYRRKGSTSYDEDGNIIWEIEISDEDLFLFWLISHGFIPLAPKSLKEAFIQRLEKVVCDEEK